MTPFGLFGGDDDATDESGDAADDDGSDAPERTDERTEERRPNRKPRVGLFVDGPNVLRDEFDVDLDDLRVAASEYGRLAFARLYLDEHATPGLVQAAEARGYNVTLTSGDVDVKLAVDATAACVEENVDVLAVASRDTDFKPVLEAAAERGFVTVAIAPGEHGRSDALQNAAHEAVTLGE